MVRSLKEGGEFCISLSISAHSATPAVIPGLVPSLMVSLSNKMIGFVIQIKVDESHRVKCLSVGSAKNKT